MKLWRLFVVVLEVSFPLSPSSLSWLLQLIVVAVCWLLIVPGTPMCASETNLLHQVYRQPHGGRSCGSNLSHPVTVYVHQINVSTIITDVIMPDAWQVSHWSTIVWFAVWLNQGKWGLIPMSPSFLASNRSNNNDDNNYRIERHNSRPLQSPHCTTVIIIVIIMIMCFGLDRVDFERQEEDNVFVFSTEGAFF